MSTASARQAARQAESSTGDHACCSHRDHQEAASTQLGLQGALRKAA